MTTEEATDLNTTLHPAATWRRDYTSRSAPPCSTPSLRDPAVGTGRRPPQWSSLGSSREW
jgi:hypothetical protein